MGTFPTGNGRSRFLFMTSRADFSVVCVSCATNLQSFGSSLPTLPLLSQKCPPPPVGWYCGQKVCGILLQGLAPGSRVALRRCPPVTADVSILTRRDIRHPQSHLFFHISSPALVIISLICLAAFLPIGLLSPRRLEVMCFFFTVISRPPTSSHQQIQTFPLRQGCTKLGGGEKQERASAFPASMLIHANAIEIYLKILKVRSRCFFLNRVWRRRVCSCVRSSVSLTAQRVRLQWECLSTIDGTGS